MRYLLATYLIFSVFISSMILLFYQNSNRILFAANDMQVLSFSFKNDITNEEAEKTVANLREKYAPAEIKIHSSKEQYDQFIKSFSMYNQGAFEPDEIIQLIPLAVDFNLGPGQDPNKIAESILLENIFDPINTSTNWTQLLQSITKFVENAGRFLFLFLFLGAALVTAATVRILISQDEERIKIRSYLGESFRLILRRYFLRTAALCLTSVALGMTTNFLVFKYFALQLKMHPEFSFITSRLHFLDVTAVVYIVSGFSLAIFLGSYLTLKRLRDRIYAEF
jgi:cell division protein FtsX